MLGMQGESQLIAWGRPCGYLLFEGAASEAPLVFAGDAHRGRRAPVVVRLRLHQRHAAVHLRTPGEVMFFLQDVQQDVDARCGIESCMLAPTGSGDNGQDEYRALMCDAVLPSGDGCATSRRSHGRSDLDGAKNGARLANAMRPLHRFCQVDAAQGTLLRLRLEVLHERPERPAGHAVLRHLGAPRAGPEQAHPVLPSPMPVMVVVMAVEVRSMR